MNILEEKAAALSKTGSFYYRSITEQSKSEANFMAHLPWQTKLFNMGRNAQSMALSKGYNKENFKIIHFTDLNIDYFGLENVLQERVHASVRTVELIQKPLVPKTANLYDYTPSENSIMIATWSNAELGDGILTPSGKLRRIELTLDTPVANDSYLEIWEETASGQFLRKGTSTGPSTLNITTGKLQWRFNDTFISGNRLKFALIGGSAVTTHVEHLDETTRLTDADSVIVGVAPEMVFYIESATVLESLITARPANLTITDVQGLINENGDLLTDENSSILLFPGESSADVPSTQVIRFGLTIDPDIFVTSIQLPNRRLIAGQDFISEFGKLTFSINPIQLFPTMKFMAHSFIRRIPNLYNYSLRLNDVYGPVNEVLRYYRTTQSPTAFYKAAAQAAGMAVVQEDCKILRVLPLFGGKLYVTDKGEYEAPYLHIWLNPGDNLAEGHIIGGEELFRLVLPEQQIPSSVQSISLDGILPVRGLEAPDEVISIQDSEGAYRPAYKGSQEALQAYWDYLAGLEQQTGETTAVEVSEENAIRHLQQKVCSGRLLIACINFQHMSYGMQQNLLTFMRREVPVGSVLTTAELNIKISETEATYV